MLKSYKWMDVSLTAPIIRAPAVLIKGKLILICREVDEDFQGAHLIYTAMGGTGCFSYVGRRVGKRGQKINLGSPECLSIGNILHKTLHALG